MERTSRIARSRSSSGYLRGAGIARGSPYARNHNPGFKDSTKISAAQWGTRRLHNSRVDRQDVPGTDKSATYGYDQAGNVTSITDVSRDGTDAQCFTYDHLTRLTEAWAQGTDGCATTKMRTYLRPAVLVVDEVGFLPLERDEANLVFQLFSKRYEKGSTLLTSNKAFSEWGQVFGDDALATAIIDRLLHHCELLAINGRSYRLKDRLAVLEGGAATTAS